MTPPDAGLWGRLRLVPVCEHEAAGHVRQNPVPPAAPDPSDPGVQIVLSLSGGKDSGALLSYVVRTYGTASQAHAARLRAVYADTGMEWPDAEAVIAQQLAAVRARWGVEIPLAVVRKQDLDGDAVGILDVVERRGFFPDRQARWCTSDFKRSPIDRWLRNAYVGGTEAGPERVLVALGIRSLESANRAFGRFGKPGAQGWTHPDVNMDVREKATSRRRSVFDWYPLYDWCPGPDGRTCPSVVNLWDGAAWVPHRPQPWQDVWHELRAYGVPVHRAYELGFPRLSCAFCIFGRPDDLRRAAEIHPDLFRRIAQLERQTQARVIEEAAGEGEGAEKARRRLERAKVSPGLVSAGHPGTPVPQGASLVEGVWLDELFREAPEVAPPGYQQLKLFDNPSSRRPRWGRPKPGVPVRLGYTPPKHWRTEPDTPAEWWVSFDAQDGHFYHSVTPRFETAAEVLAWALDEFPGHPIESPWSGTEITAHAGREARSGQLRLLNPPLGYTLDSDVTAAALHAYRKAIRSSASRPAYWRRPPAEQQWAFGSPKGPDEPLTATDHAVLAGMPEDVDLGHTSPEHWFEDAVHRIGAHLPRRYGHAWPSLLSLLDRRYFRLLQVPGDRWSTLHLVKFVREAPRSTAPAAPPTQGELEAFGQARLFNPCDGDLPGHRDSPGLVRDPGTGEWRFGQEQAPRAALHRLAQVLSARSSRAGSALYGVIADHHNAGGDPWELLRAAQAPEVMERFRATGEPPPEVLAVVRRSNPPESAGTALAREVPAPARAVLAAEDVSPGTALDLGAGRSSWGPTPHDPAHAPNPEALRRTWPVVTSFYVLNVIPRKRERLAHLRQAARCLGAGGRFYCAVRTDADACPDGSPQRTSRGWQVCRGGDAWRRELGEVFPGVEEFERGSGYVTFRCSKTTSAAVPSGRRRATA